MTRAKALLCLTIASVIVSSTVVVSTWINGGGSIFLLQLIAMAIASLALYLWNGKEKVKEAARKINRKDYMLIAMQSLLGVALFRVFIIYGVKFTRAMDAGIILSLLPVMTVIFSRIFLKNRIGRIEATAIMLATLGVFLLNINGIQKEEAGGLMRLVGNGLVFLSVLGESSFVILSKKTSPDIPPLIRSLFLSIFGVIWFLPLGMIEFVHNPGLLQQVAFWGLAIYTGLVLTVMAYIFWFTGIAYVDGVTAGVFNSLIPLSSVLLVYIFLHESMSGMQVLGLISIISGAAWITFGKQAKDKKKAHPSGKQAGYDQA